MTSVQLDFCLGDTRAPTTHKFELASLSKLLLSFTCKQKWHNEKRIQYQNESVNVFSLDGWIFFFHVILWHLLPGSAVFRFLWLLLPRRRQSCSAMVSMLGSLLRGSWVVSGRRGRIGSLLMPSSLLLSSRTGPGVSGLLWLQPEVVVLSSSSATALDCGVCIHRVERGGSEGTVNTCTEHLQCVQKL